MEKQRVKSHQYSDCADRLLETVSFLLKTMDDFWNGNGNVSEAEAALEAMKSKKEEMQKETNGRLYPTLKEGEEGAVETVQEGKYSDEGEGEYGKEGEGECTLNPS